MKSLYDCYNYQLFIFISLLTTYSLLSYEPRTLFSFSLAMSESLVSADSPSEFNPQVSEFNRKGFYESLKSVKDIKITVATLIL